MSGHGFHVHGPHDHELEHAAHGKGHHGGDDFPGRIAVTTAVLATVGAMFGYLGGATQNDAAMLKNDAAIKKTEAANQWALYQSKSNKQNLAELATLLPHVDKAKFNAEVARYKTEKEEIRGKAEGLEKQYAEADRKSAESLHQHHRWAMATTAEQVAIALAAIALLTRKKWLQYGVYGVATVGLVLGGMAWFHL